MLGRANVHRRDRRKLGRGQFPAQTPATVAVTSTGTTNATLTFNKPVVVRDTPPLAVATLTPVSFNVVSPTVVTMVMSGNVATKAYTYTNNEALVQTAQGGGVTNVAGTFP